MTTYAVDLADDERQFLVAALAQYGGPISWRRHPKLAAALGLPDDEPLPVIVREYRSKLHGGEALTAREWRYVLLLAEISFGSDVIGCGYEWRTCTGLDDAESVGVLRRVQRRLARIVFGEAAFAVPSED